MTPEILILAAGASSRMRGADKLLEQIDGQPLLTRITQAALATGAKVTVTLPPGRPQRGAALAGPAVRQITVPDAATGIAASLKAGFDSLPKDAPVLLLLADLPEITAEDLSLMLREWQATPDLIMRGTAADGTPGHPVCLPAWCRPEIQALTGDEGARSLLSRHHDRLRLVALPGSHATTDLDTPEDWAAWRGR
ncbi:MAG: nucleotidyltransferase family protein [Rhodobacterales bacterium]|nr:MAG: nucleotidyltransferase family protein [Rhodobacterales bacterium]